MTAIVTAVLVLLAAGVPVTEVQESRFYETFYYGVSAAVSLLAGMAISVSLMIGATLRDLVRIGEPQGASRLIHRNDPGEDSDPDSNRV